MMVGYKNIIISLLLLTTIFSVCMPYTKCMLSDNLDRPSVAEDSKEIKITSLSINQDKISNEAEAAFPYDDGKYTEHEINFNDTKSSIKDAYEEARQNTLAEEEAKQNALAEEEARQNAFPDGANYIKDNNSIEIKTSLRDLGSDNRAEAAFPYDDGKYTEYEINFNDTKHSDEAGFPEIVNYIKDRAGRIALHQQARCQNISGISISDHTNSSNPITDTSDKRQTFVGIIGAASGNKARRKKNKKNTNNSGPMITSYEPNEACLILGGIAEYILAKTERQDILYALSQKPKTFTDLLNETSLEENILYKCLRQLLIDGFVTRIDGSPLLFTWSDDLKKYCSTGKKYCENRTDNNKNT